MTVEDLLRHANIDLHKNFGQLVKGVVLSGLKGIGHTLKPDAERSVKS